MQSLILIQQIISIIIISYNLQSDHLQFIIINKQFARKIKFADRCKLEKKRKTLVKKERTKIIEIYFSFNVHLKLFYDLRNN